MKHWPGVLALLLCLAGCSKQDTEGLNEVGRRVVDRVGKAAGGPDGTVSLGWKGARASLDARDLGSRVYLRLKWDQYLAESDVRVKHPEPGIIELGGPIENAELRQRALDLAKSTYGVTKVVEKWEEKKS